MSWSTSTPIVAKSEAEAAIDAASITLPAYAELAETVALSGAAIDQLNAAKRAAIELLKTVPGPYVVVTMNGHANAVGWRGREGWSNDCISVSIQQVVEP